MGFGMVIRVIELLEVVTTSNYSAIANSPTQQFTTPCTKSSQLLCLHQSSGNGFQRRTFPLLWVPEVSPCIRYRLLTATAHNDRTAAALLTDWLLTNQLTSLHCTQLHCTYYLNRTLSVESYSLRMDPQRTPLATPVLLHDITADVMCPRVACVWAIA
jgi:hypothetical protein